MFALTLCACAAGGGDDRDAGRAMDAGPEDVDSSMGPTDSGPDEDAGSVDTDAGPGDDGGTSDDAGPGGMDAGPGTDAGFDAGFDAGTDAGPPGCMSAADCSDGLACNGVEICSAGMCRPGTPPVCDDGISCTVDLCNEPMATCTFTPNDSLCPGGMTCGPTGCMGACMETPCRLVSPQCGCGAGQGCYLSGSTRLCATAGAAAPGADCTGVAGCTPGNICLNISRVMTTPVNMCNAFCNTDADCAGNAICFYTLNDGMGGTVPGVTICTTDCDPVTQMGCRTGTMCTVLRETMGAMRTFADCIGPAGTGGQGTTCTDTTDCQRGLACVGTPGECLRWCNNPGVVGTAGGCATGQACYGFMPALTVGATSYGVCDTFP